MKRALCFLLAATVLVLAQDSEENEEEELVPYSPEEIENLSTTFLQTYKNKKTPEEDAVSALANLQNAWKYLEAKGEEKTKEEAKIQKKIIALISKKGLFVRRRPLIALECARILGELGAVSANNDLRRWLERVLDAKETNPQWVEVGFQSLAWIGAKDKRSLDLALDYATKGKHRDMGVAAQAMRACYEWRSLTPKVREEFFGKILGYILGLYSKWKGGDAKLRGTYKRRYEAVKDDGLKALEELAGDGSKFGNPYAANDWKKKHKRQKWQPYTGPRFREKAKKEEKPEESEKSEKKEAS